MEAKDDYSAYQKHDFLFQDKDDRDITLYSKYYQFLLLDPDSTDKTIMKYVKERANYSLSSSSFYQ